MQVSFSPRDPQFHGSFDFSDPCGAAGGDPVFISSVSKPYNQIEDSEICRCSRVEIPRISRCHATSSCEPMTDDAEKQTKDGTNLAEDIRMGKRIVFVVALVAALLQPRALLADQ